MDVLAHWNDVVNHISRKYEIAGRGEDWLQLVWSFPHEDGGTLLQVLEITRVETLGTTFVRLLARVADRRGLDANAALRLNFSFVVGQLAHHGKDAVLLHYMGLPSTLESFERALELIPHEAARLRHTLAHCHVPLVPMGQYAD